MRKKTWSLIFAGLVGVLAFTGCQSAEKGKGNEEETTVSAAKAKEPETVEVKKLAGASQTSLTKVSVHDPSIFKDKDGTYYVFGSHLAQAKSSDLIKWSYLGTQGYTNTTLYGPLGTALEKSFAWAGMNDEDSKNGYAVWAPDMVYNEDYVWEDGEKGAYMLYYCTSSTAFRSCIGYGVSKSLEGPFTYVDTLIYSGFTKESNKVTTSSAMGTKTVDTCYTNTNIEKVYQEATRKTTITAEDLTANYFNGNDYNTRLYPNAIDPAILRDKDGKMWMCYGSWSGGIYMLELDPVTGQAIHPTESSASGNHITDIYFGKKIAGGYGDSGEGPYIIYDEEEGYYYLYMSYAYLTANSGYNIRMFRSENPDGPYVDAMGKEATWGSSGHANIGVKVLGSYEMPCLTYDYMAPGHNSALIDGDKMFLVYHQRFSTGNEGHELRVHQMFMNKEGWPCVLPYEYAGEEISKDGYEKADVAGTYYLVKQDPTDNTTAAAYNAVALNEDGTLSGYLTGTWEMEEGTPYVSVTVGNFKYEGIVCKMKDEAGTDCMAVSLVGNNNVTLIGAKY